MLVDDDNVRNCMNKNYDDDDDDDDVDGKDGLLAAPSVVLRK